MRGLRFLAGGLLAAGLVLGGAATASAAPDVPGCGGSGWCATPGNWEWTITASPDTNDWPWALPDGSRVTSSPDCSDWPSGLHGSCFASSPDATGEF